MKKEKSEMEILKGSGIKRPGLWILNIILVIMLCMFSYDAYQIEMNARGAVHQILAGMSSLQATLIIIGLIIANKK